MKKAYIALAIFTIITLMSSMVFAATNTKFEVVEDNVCTIKINDYCNFEKRMVSYDLDKRQVTIQLKITNNAPVEQPTGEVMLVLDNSKSMVDYKVGDKTRQEVVYNSAKSLINKMLKDNSKLKVGIVRFSASSDPTKEGTEADASLVSALSNSASALNTAIDNIQADGATTDLDAGLTLASQNFSADNTNKYIIVLTDGLPNVALNYDKNYFSDYVINTTKSKLQSLSSKYNIITMLTGIDNPDTQLSRMPAGSTPMTYKQYLESVFGTDTNPTAGKFHYIKDEQIENTIVNAIYEDLQPQSQSIKDIKINDFFPKSIVDNFNFAYVSQPTKGTISQAIDSDNKIVWSIDELSGGETATVQYTLTLKDNYDPSIVNVILDTNEKVDITYKDVDGSDGSKTSDETPKVRITETTTPEPKNDPTVSPKILPKAGSPAFIAGVSMLAIIVLATGVKIIKINKDMHKQ